MKKTLLEMTQDILSDMDSDDVNSIDDTTEAAQVVAIIENAYNAMISTRSWPHLNKLFQFNASGTSSNPNYLKAPDDLTELVYIAYDVGDGSVNYRELKWQDPEDFLERVGNRDSSSDKIQSIVDPSGISLLIYNERHPTYWTTFDDKFIVTDAYNASVDSTLQNSKTQAKGYFTPSFSRSDDFVPNLPPDAFSQLYYKAKSIAFYDLKQSINELAVQEHVTQKRHNARRSWTLKGGDTVPNYGRRKGR